jgi:putative spermidine/putrescine transport system substrate-binding protein
MSNRILLGAALAVTITASAAIADDSAALMEGAKKEGKLVSYGMSDDWVNLGEIFKTIESKYGVEHTDTDMTSAEEVTHLLAEKDAPVMDIADIGYDFVGRLIENNLTMPYKNASWDKLPDNFKDKDGNWSVAYWGAISFLVNTDKVKSLPVTWYDLLKPVYIAMVW